MNYFLKKLKHQELGSKSNKGKAARGKYIYISKKSDVLAFFPSLSKDIKNDKAILNIIPIYQEVHEVRKCNFVYNNNYYHAPTGKGRTNEYRFYFKKLLEDNIIDIEVNDILILKSQLHWEPDENQGLREYTIYFLDIVKPSEEAYYKFCNELIFQNSSRRNDSTTLYNGTLPYFENKLQKRFSSNKSLQNKSEEDLILDLCPSCMMTGTVISVDGLNNLDLYRINPYDVGNLYENALVFSKDIGWAFTQGLFTLTNDLTIQVHSDVENNILTMYHGKQLDFKFLPKLFPNIDNITFHRENIFGKFKRAAR